MKLSVVPRALGVLTASYGGYTLVRPQSLTRAAGLTGGDLPTDSALALGRVIGARDLLSGTAMIGSPAGAALRAAVIARVGCDLSDAIGLGSAAPKALRGKVLAITIGWAALCALSLRWAGEQR